MKNLNKYMVCILFCMLSTNAESVTIKLKYDLQNVFNLKDSKITSIKYVENIINNDIEKYKLHFVLGILYSYFQIDINKAKDEFKEVVKVKDDHYLSYLNLGYLSLNINNEAEKAISYFKKALSYEPDKPEIYNALAAAYLLQNNSQEAYKVLEKGINHLHQDESLYFNQSVILSEGYTGKEERKNIIRNMNAAIKLNPREEYYSILGYYYLDNRDNLEARHALEEALKFNQKNIITILAIATTYKNTDQYEKAIEVAKQALAIEPDNKDVKDEIKEYEDAYRKWKDNKKNNQRHIDKDSKVRP